MACLPRREGTEELLLAAQGAKFLCSGRDSLVHKMPTAMACGPLLHLTQIPCRIYAEVGWDSGQRKTKGVRMKKVLLLMVAVMLIVGLMAGPAMASDPDDAEQGAQGFHGFESFYLYAACLLYTSDAAD